MPRAPKPKDRNPPVEKELKFVVDFGVAFQDDLVIPKEFQTYLLSRLKLNGETGNVNQDVVVTTSGGKVTLTSKVRLSKRYLKYMTKKYLKKTDILEYFKIVATDRATYTVEYLREKLDDN